MSRSDQVRRHMVAIGIWALSAGVANAQKSPATPAEESPAAAPAVVEDANLESFETYRLVDRFSIEIPAGWLVQEDDTGQAVTITSYRADGPPPLATDIKTEVTLVNEPPTTYVERELDSLISQANEQGYIIDQYGLAAVGNNEALRLWIIDLPGEFSEQMITFVGYETGQTAKIVSYFNDASVATKDTILQLHGSFDFATAAE